MFSGWGPTAPSSRTSSPPTGSSAWCTRFTDFCILIFDIRWRLTHLRASILSLLVASSRCRSRRSSTRWSLAPSPMINYGGLIGRDSLQIWSKGKLLQQALSSSYYLLKAQKINVCWKQTILDKKNIVGRLRLANYNTHLMSTSKRRFFFWCQNKTMLSYNFKFL